VTPSLYVTFTCIRGGEYIVKNFSARRALFGSAARILAAQIIIASVYLAASGAISTATAADLPVKAPPLSPAWSWAGFYAGVNAGYSVGEDPFAQVRLPSFSTNSIPSTASPQGAVLGGQFGYNWQVGNLLLGLEGDAQWTGQHNTACGNPCFENSFLEFDTTASRQELTWFATARLRLGWIDGNTLFYATGGPAWGGLRETDIAASEQSPPDTATFNNALHGWSAGGGIEVRLWDNWTAKFEYLHLSLGGTQTFSNFNEVCGPVVCIGPISLLTTTTAVRDDIIRVGANYRFGGTGTAVGAVLPAAAPLQPGWRGAYAGVNAGYAYGSDPFDQSVSDPVMGLQFFSQASTNIASHGPVLGGQAGYNWQADRIVLGLEVDADWGNQRATACTLICESFPGNNQDTTISRKFNWISTVRGRLGVQNSGYLLYVTGGGAFAGLSETDAFPDLPGQSMAFSETRSGWTVGGGIEAKLVGRWTGRLEYLHLDFGNASHTYFGDETLTTTSRVTDNIVRVGLNYRITD
jgi:outer membrane immunogenic protein